MPYCFGLITWASNDYDENDGGGEEEKEDYDDDNGEGLKLGEC